MKNIIACFLILLGFTACMEKSGKLPILQFGDISSIDPKNEIPLDSIVERTEIIRLTSDSNLLIGNVQMVLESEGNYYLIADDRILQFNKEGKLLNVIGKQGKGPGEFLSPWTLDVDEINQYLYVMDYFGRKMLRYHFDGAFDKKFDLPNNFAINGFKIFNGQIIYTAEVNSVTPEIYIFDPSSDKLSKISASDREMRAGEAFMGANFLMGNKNHPLLFHYFNDTVYSLADNRLHPEYLLRFGKLKIQYEELIPESDKRPGSPRIQVFGMIQSKRFTFIRYGISNFQEKRGQTFFTGVYQNDISSCSLSANLTNKEKPLFTIHSGQKLSAGYNNTLLTTVSALEVIKVEPDFGISETDNPILIKYYLR